ncbi:ASCH domain-containing protein [Leisingera sp. NJS201]|nr:ASCH domain-containing protein [Leisingera sp. NJS201]
MKALHLPLQAAYFEQIKSGEKVEEYRKATPYWRKRLEGRTFSEIILTKGYPRRDCTEGRISRPWYSWRKTTITHPHFGADPVEVYAIRVN